MVTNLYAQKSQSILTTVITNARQKQILLNDTPHLYGIYRDDIK